MKARILTTAALLAAFSPALPAVDSQLLNLLMPDAKVVGGVNVLQAKASPFGQYILSQLSTNDAGLQQMIALTGFDPTRDVNEVLFASNGGSDHGGIVAATGNFNVSSITAMATADGGATETYGGITILEDPQKSHGVAFLSGSAVVIGDIASVKAAIDRQSKPAVLPTAVSTQISQLSSSEDAWGLTTVPLTNLGMYASKNAPLPLGNGLQNSLGSVQSISGGVKFGNTVNLTVQLQADTAQNATTLAGVIQFLVNMGQLNAAKNPQAAAALQSLTAAASGNTVNVALSLPEDQLQQLMQSHANMAKPHPRAKK